MISLEFLVVGAQKAGTTFLHDWMESTSLFRLPRLKETHYFSHDERHAGGSAWYAAQFPAGPGLTGEVDPEYMYWPAAAGRIAAQGDAPRLVFVLRQPLERAFSHYQMTRRRGLEPLAFEAALAAEPGRLQDPCHAMHAHEHWSYLARGDYAPQIARLRATLPASPCHFLTFDNLVGAQTSQRTLADLCGFLGVPPATAQAVRRGASNAASEPRSQWLNRLLWQGGTARRWAGRLIRSQDLKRRLGVWLDKVNQRAPRHALSLADHELPSFVCERVRAQIEATADATGLDLSAWQARLDQIRWRSS